MKDRKKLVLQHVLIVSLFLLMPVLISTRPPGEAFLTVTRPLIRDIIGNFLLLAFFYLNYYRLVPKFYFNQRYIVYGLIVLFFFAVLLFFPSLVTGHFQPGREAAPLPPGIKGVVDIHPDFSPGFFLFTELRHHVYLFAVALFFSLLLRIRTHLAEIKEEKLRAELSSLKSQINPHFLFNTLNSIYALSVKKDDRTSEAIINLSGLMRYVIKDANDYKIPLQKEIDYIRNYIELQKSRLGNTVSVIFDCSGNPDDKKIAPLILITYIENAFKYGVNPDVDNCIIEINIQITDAGIKMYVFNKKVALSGEIVSTGIGVTNTNERLKLLYPEKHTSEVNENDETYSVTLSIALI